MKTEHLLMPTALVIGSLAIALSVIAGVLLTTTHLAKIAKSEAVQGCYQVAAGTDISGSIEKNGWTVEKANINADVLKECMNQKGL